jgi:hypothetical protein
MELTAAVGMIFPACHVVHGMQLKWKYKELPSHDATGISSGNITTDYPPQVKVSINNLDIRGS